MKLWGPTSFEMMAQGPISIEMRTRGPSNIEMKSLGPFSIETRPWGLLSIEKRAKSIDWIKMIFWEQVSINMEPPSLSTTTLTPYNDGCSCRITKEQTTKITVSILIVCVPWLSLYKNSTNCVSASQVRYKNRLLFTAQQRSFFIHTGSF